MTASLIARPQLAPVAAPTTVRQSLALAVEVRADVRAAIGAHSLDAARVARLVG